eukprot:CAMPEP_0196665508 /NCGR_PEP_ID=MMETSP1086-20130531/61377_1 /TAXON_ID=77921 /ORGANISM="Cyanoptyche  gloeocystis , Strain SAG4.97" /LENGTH=84 /DNA_ID=CAMNT_0042002309 /DNA_START=320 /DNA_END=574 /DNA_ORIENTATION=-
MAARDKRTVGLLELLRGNRCAGLQVAQHRERLIDSFCDFVWERGKRKVRNAGVGKVEVDIREMDRVQQRLLLPEDLEKPIVDNL